MNDPRELWKQYDETLSEPLPTRICALARRRERESVWGRAISLFALAGLAAAFAHNTWQVHQPWVRLGQGWMLIAMIVSFWNVIRDRTHLRRSSEACGSFLLRALKRKRDGYIAVRRFVPLLIPAILASWWGGGAGVWPMIAICLLLFLVWLAFGATAKKASSEFEALRHLISPE